MRKPGTSTVLAVLLALVAAFAIAGCGEGDETTSTTRIVDEEVTTADTDGSAEATTCEDVEAPGPKSIELEAPEVGSVLEQGEAASAIVETSCGTFTIELDTERAPITSNSFAYMSQEGLYDDLAFHRVVPDFVFQGGDTDGSGNGGSGYSVVEPPPDDLAYVRGVVAMAKTTTDPPGTSSSQFFVVVGADAGLPSDYALLGEVVDGLDVVDLISQQAEPGTDGPPLIPIVIRSITIETGS